MMMGGLREGEPVLGAQPEHGCEKRLEGRTNSLILTSHNEAYGYPLLITLSLDHRSILQGALLASGAGVAPSPRFSSDHHSTYLLIRNNCRRHGLDGR
jgi:hypothetical protein